MSNFSSAFLPSNSFKAESVDNIRMVSQLVDEWYGNQDGELNAQESQTAARVSQFFQPSMSGLFVQLSLAIQQGNTRVDPDGNGSMSIHERIFLGDTIAPGDSRSELTKLAQMSGKPDFVESSDINSISVPPTPFRAEYVETVRRVSQFIDTDQDGMLSADEALVGSNLYRHYNPNISRLLSTVATALRNGNSSVDANNDGHMSYNNFFPFPTFAPIPPDELSELAKRSGSKQFVETSDFQ